MDHALTIGDRTRTHGMTNSRLYSVWCGIKCRCYNSAYKHFDRYGGRGIAVCPEWRNSFEAFEKWALDAGYDESLTGKEQSLDRIDVNGNYEPSNCRWVNFKQQARNREDTVYVKSENGSIPAREFAEKNNIPDYVFVFRRAKKGQSAEKILCDWNMLYNTQPEYMRIADATSFYSVSEMTIRNWIKSRKLKAEKYGNVWLIPKGQVIVKK